MKKESKPAYEWLLDRLANEWSKSHFLTKVKSDILLNNLCECFNKLLLEDRDKSIVTMLIDMHISTMKRIQTRRDKMRRVIGPLCPKIHDKLVKNLEVADGSEVDWSGGAQWYVRTLKLWLISLLAVALVGGGILPAFHVAMLVWQS